METKLKIEELAPYLPYDLEVYLFERRYTITGVTQETLFTKQGAVLNYANSDSEIKIILRPLSDLINQIEHNGEKFVPIDNIKYLFGWEDIWYYVTNPQVNFNVYKFNYACILKLLEWHFDVFSLIDKNLAINLNEVK